MKILVIHLGTQSECFAASSVIKGITSKYGKNTTLYFIVKDKFSEQVYRYNPNVKKTYIIDKVPFEFLKETYDLFINLHPDFSEKSNFSISAKEKIGFNIEKAEKNRQDLYKALYEDKKINKNIFQIYFNLANLKWQGEGFDINYHPKIKTKKNLSGLAVANANLRNHIIQHLRLDLSKIWVIPFRQNLYKKMDEINRCSNIVTDDFLTMYASLYLRKSVCFLETMPANFEIELFGSGNILKIPKNIVCNM